MSRINVDAIHSEDGADACIELADNKNVTFKGNIAVDGTIPADKLTGALPAISGASLTGIASAGKAKNLIHNGDFQVWQRSTDDTSSPVSGYCGPDRWQKSWYAGTVTGKKLDLTSSDTLPWNDGFRSAFQVKCTSTTTNSDRYCQVEQVLEAQDVAKSGWKYTDSNSKVRIQFYARSSLAGTYWCRFTSVDGTGRSFPYSYSLSANTWTKVSFAVPGDSNVTVDNNSDAGFRLNISQYLNTGLTDDASVTSGSWMNWDSDKAAEDYDQDWMGSANATFDITGVQITVGETAGDFQHRSYGDELAKCQRYYYAHRGTLPGETRAGDDLQTWVTFPVVMRATPSRTQEDGSVQYYNRLDQGNSTSATTYTYSGMLSNREDLWIVRPADGDAWDTQDGRTTYYLKVENTEISYSWDAEL